VATEGQAGEEYIDIDDIITSPSPTESKNKGNRVVNKARVEYVTEKNSQGG